MCSVAFGQRPLGVDVSHYQGNLTQTAWNNCYAAGRRFAATKATEGLSSGLNDSTLVNNITRARTAGIYIGPYHFAHPESNSAVAEADHFYAVAGAYMTSGYLRPMLDLESGGGVLSDAAMSQWINAFCDEVKLKAGVEPFVYCNTNYASNYMDASVASRTLWVANYNGQNPQTGDPGTGVFPEWDFWQYASTETGSGLTTNGIDGDVFHNLGNRPSLDKHVVPLIIRSPATLSQTATAGNNPASQSFTVRNGVTGITLPLDYVISSNVAWLTTSPTGGSSSGETDTINVNYVTTTLAPGTYNGTLSITNGTTFYTPATLSVTLTVNPISGDLNNDGKVNESDLTIFYGCMTGAAQGPPVSGCMLSDLDHDNDVDTSDFGILQRCLNGQSAPRPDCAN